MTRPPRIVMVSGQSPPALDGVGDYTARLIAELAIQRPSWRWYWIARRPGWRRSPVVFGPGYMLFRPNSTWSRRGRWIASVLIKRLKPDLIHIQDQIHSFFETNAAPLLAAAANCPVVTTLHEYHVERPSVVHTDELLRRSAAIIANDARNAARCLERTGREPDARWWSGSNVALPGPGDSRRIEPDLVTTFGFISALKSIELPLQAMQRLRGQGRPLRWRIVGPFDPETNVAHAPLADLRRLGWVEFTGALHGHRLTDALATSCVMILPFADGASVRRTTLQTAWAFGIPVITTPPTHDEPAIIDGENCLLVPEPTAEAWADALARLLGDPALEARLRQGGLRMAESLGWPELARRHLTLYDRLLADRPAGPTPRP